MKSRAEIKAIAWQNVKRNYWPAVGVVLLGLLMTSLLPVVPVAGWILSLLVVTVITAGMCGVTLNMYKGESFGVGGLFAPFNDYGRVLGGMLWRYLFLFLWTLLFVVPGIVKYYSYFCAPYILARYPRVGATDALELSKKMMDGNKGKVFVAQLSFLGWYLVAGAVVLVAVMIAAISIPSWAFFTRFEVSVFAPVALFGASAIMIVGYIVFYAALVFFLWPYFQVTMAGFFEEIKNDALARGVITPNDLGEGGTVPPQGGPQGPWQGGSQQPGGPQQPGGGPQQQNGPRQGGGNPTTYV